MLGPHAHGGTAAGDLLASAVSPYGCYVWRLKIFEYDTCFFRKTAYNT